MEVRHITHASEAELNRMADILMDAFGDDAILLRCSGNSHNNLRRAMRMRAEKTIPHGGQDSPEAVSVSMSKATDADPIPDEIKEWIATSVRPPIHQLELESFGPDGEKKSMYVHFLAVDPAGRGKGVGKLLLKEAFKIADESGVRTTLLNPKELNLTIYGRLGFIKAGNVQIKAPDATHTLWTMYREPASS